MISVNTPPPSSQPTSTGFNAQKLLQEAKDRVKNKGVTPQPPSGFLESPILSPTTPQVSRVLQPSQGTPSILTSQKASNKAPLKEKHPVSEQPPSLYGKGADGKPFEVQLPQGAEISEDKRTLTTSSGNLYTLSDDGTLTLQDKNGEQIEKYHSGFNHPARNFLDRNVPQPPYKSADGVVRGITLSSDGSLEMRGLGSGRLGGLRTLPSNDPVAEFFPQGSVKQSTSDNEY
jgi:hypothetical protein